MMLPDQQRYIVIAKRRGQTVASEIVLGTHMLPDAMAWLGLHYDGVTIEWHKSPPELRLVHSAAPASDAVKSGMGDGT